MANHEDIKKEKVELWRIVGQGMSEWSRIEFYIYFLLDRLVKPNNQDALSGVYYSIYSFNNKLDMINSVINICYKKPNILLDNWAPIFNRLKIVSRKRNKLAHYSDINFNDQSDGAPHVALSPHLTNAKMSISSDDVFPDLIYSIEAKKILMEIIEIQGKLRNFMDKHISDWRVLPLE